MTDRDEKELDAALAGLAAETHGRAPLPGADLTARVLADAEYEAFTQKALAELAADAAQNTPRPGPDLVARVLADAAAVSAQQHQPVTGARPQRPSRGFSLNDLLFGWASGAAAAMALALIVGIGVGMQLEDGDLPMTEPEAQISVFAADDGLLPEEFL